MKTREKAPKDAWITINPDIHYIWKLIVCKWKKFSLISNVDTDVTREATVQFASELANKFYIFSFVLKSL